MQFIVIMLHNIYKLLFLPAAIWGSQHVMLPCAALAT